MIYLIDSTNSSLIESAEYNDETKELTIVFKKYYLKEATYVNFPVSYWEAFTTTKSLGQFYLGLIKPKFSQKIKTQSMARRILKCKIDVTKVNRDWFFVGEKGTYLNFTLLYDPEKDERGNNGMIVQDVPTPIYNEHKHLPKKDQPRGEILGNAKEFGATIDEESKPGVESGKMKSEVKDFNDDLPF